MPVVRIRISFSRDWFTMKSSPRDKSRSNQRKKVASRDDSHFARGHIAVSNRTADRRRISQNRDQRAHVHRRNPPPATTSSAYVRFTSLTAATSRVGKHGPASRPTGTWNTEFSPAACPGARVFSIPSGETTRTFICGSRTDQGRCLHRTLDPHPETSRRGVGNPQARLQDRDAGTDGCQKEQNRQHLGHRTKRRPHHAQRFWPRTIVSSGRASGSPLEVIAKGSRTVILVNGKGPANNRWNQRDTYRNGAHIAFEQNRDSPPVEIPPRRDPGIRRVERVIELAEK